MFLSVEILKNQSFATFDFQARKLEIFFFSAIDLHWILVLLLVHQISDSAPEINSGQNYIIFLHLPQIDIRANSRCVRV